MGKELISITLTLLIPFDFMTLLISVVYLEGAFTRLTGNTGKQWLCAQTIIHELSHHDISTQDHRYDHHGLKPNKASFPYTKVIENADSWGYFALNLAGYLSQSDFENVWK